MSNSKLAYQEQRECGQPVHHCPAFLQLFSQSNHPSHDTPSAKMSASKSPLAITPLLVSTVKSQSAALNLLLKKLNNRWGQSAKVITFSLATFVSVLAVIGMIKKHQNLSAYKIVLKDRERKKKSRKQGKNDPDASYRKWCRKFAEDWNGEEMVIAIEGNLFPRGGSYATLPSNPVPPKEHLVRSISFAGGGFRTISYVGQLIYLEKRGMIDVGKTKFYGASLGALVAVGMIIGETNMEARLRIISGMLEYVCEVHNDWIGMWGLCGTATRQVLENALPEDVSTINGRIFIAVTVLLPYPHCQLVSEFKSKQDLIETLLASQFIPLFTEGIPLFKFWRGRPCIDGGIFDNIPTPLTHQAGNKSVENQRDMFGVISPKGLSESFARPSLRREDGHFTCRDPDAPVAQVLRPPHGECVESTVFEEVRRGYLEARAAIVGYPRSV
jgi:hypothetical protein